jgi:hypothetical protein
MFLTGVGCKRFEGVLEAKIVGDSHCKVENAEAANLFNEILMKRIYIMKTIY